MKVVVQEYDESWPATFTAEAARLREIFGAELAAIHHIGSTAVPGLPAKPIIDIMPVVQDIARVDELNGKMAAFGYEPCGEFGIKGRRFFRKGGEDRTHHVHVFQADNHTEIDRHLSVRNYLRAHPEAALEYGELKARLAKLFPEDIEAYMYGKDDFVKNLEQKALKWQRTKRKEGSIE